MDFKRLGRLAGSGFLDVCEYYATTRLGWDEIRRGRATVERSFLTCLERSGADEGPEVTEGAGRASSDEQGRT